jgi:hypothetical protein
MLAWRVVALLVATTALLSLVVAANEGDDLLYGYAGSYTQLPAPEPAPSGQGILLLQFNESEGTAAPVSLCTVGETVGASVMKGIIFRSFFSARTRCVLEG